MQTSGAFIICIKNGELTFIWKPYHKSDKETESQKELNLPLSSIISFMVNYQEHDKYLLITSKSSIMHQLTFELSSQFIQFMQILTLHQHSRSQKQAPIEDLLSYSIDSYVENDKKYGLYVFEVEIPNIVITPDFFIPGFEEILIPNVKPDILIISQFNIKSNDYTDNPVLFKELQSFSRSQFKESICQRGIGIDDRHLVWPVLFGILPSDPEGFKTVLKARTDEYILIRNQWQNMPRWHFKYCSLIKDAFNTIKVDVKRTHPMDEISNLKDWDSILSSILKTFSIWNLDVRYTQGLNDLALTFLSVFLPYSGTEYTADECEALIFWCFSAFVEFISSGLIAENMLDNQSIELKEIMSIIMQFHPACAEWLNAKGLGDLSFLIASFILAYGRSFEPSSVARIWEALVSVEAPWLFLRYFSASLIILSYQSFAKIPNCSSGKLVSVMDQIFYHQDVGAVIGVSLSMMKKSKNEMQTQMKLRNTIKKQSETTDYFCPISQFSDIYSKYPSMFM
ncbi:hypothetical protein TVAG_210110 [Trichomonas vaginalis G3]|uniref:Rab-GAP TBC domain-containing protein n=1 Tax=Trichomonas vaginalis (strain ATCC PRA-98 / G3) TaxID=412133 RepID=A2DVR8_TRIV3|nr:regulation of vesicle fusion [Trichomonas vaginalis G3]EAY15481.1 hypothetical protein TVAG_210110 [Trichomonas vaginalis G3]KAI5511491.1 regulation of vesicle fusion [Trichomonas vaginalis G3]|eukprot:XP_001327704.1 hypothetical protein [Trichomonas vaginalis G3]